MTIIPARALIDGEAEGHIVAWSTPLSFWGGLDAASGRVIDRSHPAFGAEIGGRVLAMPSGRGSSSASSVLAEAIRRGTSPAAIVLTIPDAIIVVGAIVAERLYGRTCPVLVCEPAAFERLADGAYVRVTGRGDASTISIERSV